MDIARNLGNLGIFTDNNKSAQLESSKSTYAGRVMEYYANTATSAQPTRFKAVNLAARAMFAILAVAPFAIATVGALLADVTAMTAKGISNAYNAIRNRFAKAPEAPQSAKEKVLAFASENKGHFYAAMSVVAFVGALYLSLPRQENCAPFWKDIDGQCVRLRDDIRNLNSKCPAESNGWGTGIKLAASMALPVAVPVALAAGRFLYGMCQSKAPASRPSA